MLFWKFFAWIALAWAALFRRAGITIKTSARGDAEKPLQQSGPGWRLVSTKTYPGSAAESEKKDRSGDREG